MLREFFDGSNQIGMLVAQWLELVEKWINHQRGDHDESEEYQDSGKPEVEPPMPRTAPHHAEQDPDQNNSKRDMEKFPLGPIPEPRAPALNRLFIVNGKRMPVQAQGKLQNVDGQEEQRDENKSLNPFLVADIFGDIAKLCGPAQPKDQKQQESAEKIGNEIKRIACPRVRHCLRLALMRKRILLGRCLFGSLQLRKRTCRRIGLLRRCLQRRRFSKRECRGARKTVRCHREI